MWNTFLQSAASALERTGDILTEKATESARRNRVGGGSGAGRNDPPESGGGGVDAAAAAGAAPTIATIPPAPPGERTGGAGYEDVGPGTQQPLPDVGAHLLKFRDSVTNFGQDKERQQEVLGRLQVGWGSVVEATRRAAEATKEVAEKERARIEAQFKKGPYKRGEEKEGAMRFNSMPRLDAT